MDKTILEEQWGGEGGEQDLARAVITATHVLHALNEGLYIQVPILGGYVELYSCT